MPPRRQELCADDPTLVQRLTDNGVRITAAPKEEVHPLLGMLLSSGILLRQRASLSKANRQLVRTRAEVDKLRTAGLKDGE